MRKSELLTELNYLEERIYRVFEQADGRDASQAFAPQLGCLFRQWEHVKQQRLPLPDQQPNAQSVPFIG
jgi:hypothetical protein